MFYKEPNPAAGIDGYSLVSKAIALRGKTDPQMELAAALITLRGPQKVEALRKLGVSFDEKISPLLNPQQQQKFQAMREQMRRRILAEAADTALQKGKAAVATWFADVHK